MKRSSSPLKTRDPVTTSWNADLPIGPRTFAAGLWSNTDCAAPAGVIALPSGGKGGGFMEDGVERRAARRFSMMLPLKVRFTSGDDITEKPGETRDVSFRGLYFLVEATLETGSSDRICSDPSAADHPGGRCPHPLLRARPSRRGAQRTPGRCGAHRALRIPACSRLNDRYPLLCRICENSPRCRKSASMMCRAQAR